MTMGIHHVTGIAGDAQQNVDFYAGVLGLRLVKKTINYDDPRTYHLYYGDTEGTPGSLLTFFPWPGARRGRAGVGPIHHVAFRARDAAAQLQLREKVTSLGFQPAPVIDGPYFQSVYGREPGNVLFEVAPDGPGFTVDEPLKSLGESLTLPSRLAADRASIEMVLPALHRPQATPLHETPDAPKANV